MQVKRIILNHLDLDAVGVYLVLDYFNIHYDEILSCDYNRFENEKEFSKLLKYDEIFTTDYSISKNLVEKLLSQNKKVVIIDHHKNEETKLLNEIKNNNFVYFFDDSKSGTLLAYEYFKPKNVRVKKSFFQAIELINTYDLFKKDSILWEDAQNMNRVLFSCLNWNDEEMKRFDWIKEYWQNKLAKYNEWFWTDFELKKINNAIEKETKQFNESKSSLKKYTDDKGVKFGITVAKSKVSLVALKLLEQNEDIKYIIMINTYSGFWDKLSLRSRDEKEFDCNSFEECKGHSCASGGEVDQDFAAKLYKGMISLTYKEN
jgi:oligoribonuclease NrnB/cAMP/cGMP phosphodiesterase (DHH superfamily)